jgi:hypothetical protein
VSWYCQCNIFQEKAPSKELTQESKRQQVNDKKQVNRQKMLPANRCSTIKDRKHPTNDLSAIE